MRRGWGPIGSALKKARQNIEQSHPGTVASPASLPDDLLPQLRRRLVEAQEGGYLDRFAEVLSPREIRALVRGLPLWPELANHIVTVLGRVELPGLARELWGAWQRSPSLPPLRTLLLARAEACGWEFVDDSRLRLALASWVRADAPGEAIRRWLDAQGLSYSDLDHMAHVPLRSDTPLTRLVRDAVLRSGSSSQLRTEGAKNLLRWGKELHPEDQKGFGANYLMRLETGEWSSGILDWIKSTFGLPNQPRIASFWPMIDEERRRAFQKLFFKKQLRTLIPDNARYRYWERWIDSDAVQGIREGRAGTVPFVVIDFGTFAVVEFFEEGNAAYFYTKKELDRVLSSRVYHPSDLKDIRYRSDGSNRLIHRGGSGAWGMVADQMVRRWSRRS